MTEWFNSIESSLPEFAPEKKARYIKDFGLPEYDANMITGQKALADFFEETTAICNNPKEGFKLDYGRANEKTER